MILDLEPEYHVNLTLALIFKKNDRPVFVSIPRILKLYSDI